MIRLRNISPDMYGHPNMMGVPFFVGADDPDQFVTAVAESALTVNQPLTILTSGVMPGSPMALAFTLTAGAAWDTDLRIVGTNQFGKQVEETLAVTTQNTVLRSNHAYKRVSSITPTRVGGASAVTVAVGVELAAGGRIGLPFVPNDALAGGTSPGAGEIVALLDPSGAFEDVQSISQRFATATINSGLTVGCNWLLTDFQNLGQR